MKDFIYYILYLAAILGLIKFIMWYGKNETKKAAQELQYDIMYLNLKTIINDWEVNEKSYHAIWKFLATLEHLPHKNKEKTTVLTETFLDIYRPIIEELKSEEEFSPESILRK